MDANMKKHFVPGFIVFLVSCSMFLIVSAAFSQSTNMSDQIKVSLIYPVVKIAIGIIILLIINAIICSLPMMNEVVIPKYHLSIAYISNSIVGIVIIILILTTSNTIKHGLEILMPSFPEIGKIWSNAAFFIVILIAYGIFRRIIKIIDDVVYIENTISLKLYSIIFLIVMLVPLVKTGIIAYKNFDKIASIIVLKKPIKKCDYCDHEILSGSAYCENCGKYVESSDSPFFNKVSQEKSICPKCLGRVDEEATYCRHCGYYLKDPLRQEIK
jgi:ribosomal protein L40E